MMFLLCVLLPSSHFFFQFKEDVFTLYNIERSNNSIAVIVCNLLIRLDTVYHGLHDDADYIRLYTNLMTQIYDKSGVHSDFRYEYEVFLERLNEERQRNPDRENVLEPLDPFDLTEEFVPHCSIPQLFDLPNMTKLLFQSMNSLGFGLINGQHRVGSQIQIFGCFSESSNEFVWKGVDRRKTFNMINGCLEPGDNVMSSLGRYLNVQHQRLGKPDFNLLFCPGDKDFSTFGMANALRLSERVEANENLKQSTNTQDISQRLISHYGRNAIEDQASIPCQVQKGYLHLTDKPILIFLEKDDNAKIEFPGEDPQRLHFLIPVLNRYAAAYVHHERLSHFSKLKEFMEAAKVYHNEQETEKKEAAKLAEADANPEGSVQPPKKKQKPSTPSKPFSGEYTVMEACLTVLQQIKDHKKDKCHVEPKCSGTALRDYVYGPHNVFFVPMYAIVQWASKVKLANQEASLWNLYKTPTSEIKAYDPRPKIDITVTQALILQNIWYFWRSVLSQQWDTFKLTLTTSNTNKIKILNQDQESYHPWMFLTFQECCHTKHLLVMNGTYAKTAESNGRVWMMPRSIFPIIQFLSLLALEKDLLLIFGSVVSRKPADDPFYIFNSEDLRQIFGCEIEEGSDHLIQRFKQDSASEKEVSKQYCITILYFAWKMLTLSSAITFLETLGNF